MIKKEGIRITYINSLRENIRYYLDRGFTPLDLAELTISRIKNLFHKVRSWFKHAWQRVFNGGIDDTMTWSMDETLAGMIAKMLRQYLDHADTLIEIPDERRRYIEECIGAFNEYTEFHEMDVNTEEEQKLFETDMKALHKLKMKQYKKLLRRMQKLFTEDYGHLWW